MSIVPRLGSGIPLVARVDEMRTLRASFARAEEGEPGAVLVSGDAGVGKTRLLAELGALASARGALVLTGRGLDVVDGGLPYLPFAGAFGPLLDSADPEVVRAVRSRPALRRLLPELASIPRDTEHATMATADPETSRRARGEHDIGQLQLFDAVIGLLTELAADRPVLLVLEDLHWADGSTRNLLSFLVSRLREQRLLVLCSYREEDVHRRHPLRALLAELVRLATVERVELRPFGPADALAFVEALAEEPLDPDLAADVAERSEGNPFFVEELLASCVHGVDLPAGLAEVLLARVERLSATTRRLLRVVSVADGGVSHAALAEVAGIGEDELDEAMREAVQHHVLVVERQYYTFRHALLREAVYGDLLPGERVRTHAAYAERLRTRASGRGDAARLAYHSRESNDLPTALSASLRAAEESERAGAPGVALRHVEAALAIWDAVPESARPAELDEPGLLDEASYFAGTSGEPERAIAYSRSALENLGEGVGAERAAKLWRRLAQTLVALDGTEQEAVEAIERAWSLVADAVPSRDRAWVLATLAAIRRVTGGHEQAVESAHAAIADAHAVGATGAEADALVTLARTAERTGDTGCARERLHEAIRKARQAGALTVELRARHNLGLSYEDKAELDAALRHYREGMARARETGLTWGGYGLELRARELYLRYVSGDWPERTTAARAERRVPIAVAARMAAAGVYFHVARGDHEQAERLVAEMRQQWHTDVIVAVSVGAAGTESAYWQGKHEQAIARASETTGWLDQFGDHLLAGVRIAALGLAACVAAAAAARRHGREDTGAVTAGEEFATYARECAELGVPHGEVVEGEGRAWTARAAAAASGLRGPADPRLWAEAVRAFGYGAVYEQAVCRLHHAEALLGHGEDGAPSAEAEAELLAAHTVAARLGAVPLRAAVRDLAARARVDLPGAPVRRDVVDPLTERERSVLERVALGHTNRQVGAELYISEKTVSVHLSRVMAKLGAHRRAEAVAIAYDRGLLTSPPVPAAPRT
ncbi:LuxR family transcriptional regulator [Amycolatopsis antarctica]|uniref:LuxR family transcriptional regulator n=1 Tax=Amycolatopsis antarctica TaxID=1854586 RepID=A0A263D8N1_9PSEU|nr:AAA family ATPase [Amycolatopsis antarctica]OZM74549.1 LuxR family transcriptional regulator [Amycolatopsis antarctica]